MKKRMISVVLVLAMALSMTMAVSAADWESAIDPVGVAVVGNTYYQTVQQAVDAAGEGEFVKLIADPKGEEVTNSAAPLYLDLHGYSVTINGGSVYLIDSATDDGDVGGTLSGSIEIYQDKKVTEKDETANGGSKVQYLVLENEDGTKTANAVRVQLIRVTIRPGTDSAGIYYTTNFVFNKNVVTAGATYGVVLSVVDKPEEDFAEEINADTNKYENLWTAINAKADGKFEQNGNSCLCANILTNAEGEDATANARRGATPIYANAYVKVNGATIMAENTAEVKYSIRTIMEAFNNSTLVEPAKTNVLSFYGVWKDAMTDWAITKIVEAYNAANPAE